MSINIVFRKNDACIRDNFCSFFLPEELAEIEPTSKKVHQFIYNYRKNQWDNVQKHPFIKEFVTHSTNFHYLTPKEQLVLIDHLVKVALQIEYKLNPHKVLERLICIETLRKIGPDPLDPRDPVESICRNLNQLCWDEFLIALAPNHFDVLQHINFKIVNRECVDLIAAFCLKHGQTNLFNKILRQTNLYNSNGLSFNQGRDALTAFIYLAVRYGHWDIFESLLEKRKYFPLLEDNTILLLMILWQDDKNLAIHPENHVRAIALFFDKMLNLNNKFIDPDDDYVPDCLHVALSLAANLALFDCVPLIMSKISDIRILEEVRDQYDEDYCEERVRNEYTIMEFDVRVHVHQHPRIMYDFINEEIQRRQAQ